MNKSATTAFLALFALATLATAGSLTPPGSPASTMNTLAEVFDSIAGSFDSSLVVADQNGSLIEHLKYIEANMGGTDLWASNSFGIYETTTTRKVGIGTSSPNEMLTVVGNINLASATAGYQLNGATVLRTAGFGSIFVGELAANSTTGCCTTAVGYESLFSNTTGFQNTAVGYDALYSNTTGQQNTAVGYNALLYNSTGDYNVAIGPEALRGDFALGMTGTDNIALGRNALHENSTGIQNVALGLQALQENSSGNDNIAIGSGTLAANVTGYDNTAVGSQVLQNNSTGIHNTGLGRSALFFNLAGIQNTALGYQSLFYNTGDQNTGLGTYALYNNNSGNLNTSAGYRSSFTNTTGVQNAAFGAGALYLNTLGSDNVAVGASAGYSFTGSGGVFIGRSAGYSTTTGANNTAVGNSALFSNDTGSDNTAIGSQALFSNVDGIFNTAIGVQTLYSNTSGIFNTATGFGALVSNTTGSENSAYGGYALLGNTTGSDNTAMGIYAMQDNDTGSNNSAYGASALTNNTSGANNAAYGYGALFSNTTGTSNTATGYFALRFNTTADSNTAVGYQALDNASTGGFNTAVGRDALGNVDTGDSNIAIGYAALAGTLTGVQNTAIGVAAGFSTSGSGNVFLGYLAGNAELGSDRLYIDNSSTASPLIYGQFDTNQLVFNGNASISGNFELTGRVSSNLTPTITDTFDLGTSALRWRDLYLASGSLHIGTSGDEAVIDYNVNDDYLSFKPDGSTTIFRLYDNGNASISGDFEVAGSLLITKLSVPLASVSQELEVSGVSSLSQTFVRRTDGAQAEFSGWDEIGGAAVGGGQLHLGANPGSQGRIHYNNANSSLYIDNTYAGSTGQGSIFMRTSNSPTLTGLELRYDSSLIAAKTKTTGLGTPSLLISDAIGALNTLYSLGLGYSNGPGVLVPAEIAFQETNGTGNTFGDLLFALRSVNSNTVPVERMRITAQGLVGIASSSPGAVLSVVGTGSFNPFTVASASGATLFRITKSGNVGIGTTTPAAKVDIYSGTNEGLRISTDDATPYPFMINNLTHGSTDGTGFGLWQADDGSGILSVNDPDHDSGVEVAIQTNGRVVAAEYLGYIVNPGDNRHGVNGIAVINDTASSSQDVVGAGGNVSFLAPSGTTDRTTAGSFVVVTGPAAGGTINNAIGLNGGVQALGATSIGNAYAGQFGILSSGSTAMTNAFGIDISSLQVADAGTVTNNYGLYINDQDGLATTLNYNLYSNGTGLNYFGGNVGIGILEPEVALEIMGVASVSDNIRWGGGANMLNNDQGGSIELGGVNTNPVPGGTPFIDFHYGNGIAEDYNYRIRNAADEQLDFRVGSGVTMTLLNRRVGIGTDTPGVLLHVASTAFDGDIFRLQDSDGDCTVNPEAVTTFSCSSDRRLKDDIEDTQPILARIMDFRVRDFTMRSSGDHQTGVIAQEVQETWPDMVSMGASGYLKVEQPNPWLVIKAIQELNGKIDSLATAGPVDFDSEAWFSGLFDRIIERFASLLGIEFGEGRITTEQGSFQRVCLGDTCITESELRALMQQGGVEPTDTPEMPTPTPTTEEPSATPSPEISVEPTPQSPEPGEGESTPEPTEEPTPEPTETPAE